MLFFNKSGCEVRRCSNNIDFVLFLTATSMGSPFTTIYINSTIVDAVDHICLRGNCNLDVVVIKRASETTAGVSRWLFISTNLTIHLKM